MDEARFRQVVAAALKDLSLQVDPLLTDDMDAKLTDGVFQVEFGDRSVFVLSQQVPLRELWLSANRRAWHFRFQDGLWQERDTQEPLHALLSSLFSAKLGTPAALTNPTRA